MRASANSLKYDERTGVYWKESDKVPYCPTCYENYNKHVHLIKNDETSGEDEVKFGCSACEGDFYIERKNLR